MLTTIPSLQSVIHPTAKIGNNVSIGHFSYIGENVTIGDHCVIGNHVVIERNTFVGSRNKIFRGSIIGQDPQHKNYRGEESFLIIGNDNIIREYVTINLGTKEGGNITKIGDSNYIMAYVHIAHDVLIGHNNSIVNATQIAGHVEIGNNAVIGGMSQIHQFCKIGDMAMIAMQSRINMDVAPYILVDGNPSKLIGLNTVGLKRNGLTPLDLEHCKKCIDFSSVQV